MVLHFYFDFNAFNAANRINPENIMRIEFLETEKVSKIEKMLFFGVSQNTPVSREHVQ